MSYEVVHCLDLYPRIEVISNVGQPLFEWIITRYGEPMIIMGDQDDAEVLAALLTVMERDVGT